MDEIETPAFIEKSDEALRFRAFVELMNSKRRLTFLKDPDSEKTCLFILNHILAIAPPSYQC